MKKDKQKGFHRRFCMVLSRMLLALFLMVFIATTFLFIRYYGTIMTLYKDSVKKVESINPGTFKSKMPTIIYDKDNKVLTELAPQKYEYIESKDIQSNIKNAFIAIEDNRFLEHNGVDLKGITRASLELFKNKGKITQGGSTITQQLVKNVLLTQEQSYSRKIKEIFISLKLEKKYNKEQVLEFYINNIYFGNGAYGIESASKKYFNKPSKELTLAEVTFLCAIPNNPTMYNPVTNKDNTLKRSFRILEKMKGLNFINEEDYKKSINQEIQLNVQEEKPIPENYLISYALNCATKEVMIQNDFKFQNEFKSEKERVDYWNNENEAFQEAYMKIRNGGYKIYTSLDTNKQQLLQEQINNKLSNLSNEVDSETNLYKFQGAGVCIDNKTGNVTAIVGGRTQDGIENTFNRGYLAIRQPGSTIKPIVAYAPAYELGLLPTSIMNDSYIPQGPKNHDKSYSGSVTLRYATEVSINTIPFKILMNYEASNLLKYLYKMNFKYITPQDDNPIIAVGGFTRGVTTEEMAGAYSTLARNGEYIKTTCIEKIEDYSNEIIYENKHEKVIVYDKGGAYLTTDTLKGVIEKPHATGHRAKLNNGFISAGKTGTTDSTKDAWFCGYTPYFTTAIWVGADNPVSMDNLYGDIYPGAIWKGFMDEIHKGYKNIDFNKPNEVFDAYVSYNYQDYSLEYVEGWNKVTVTKKFTQVIDERKRKEEEERKRLEAERERQRKIEEQKRLEKEKREIEQRERDLKNTILPKVKTIRIKNEADLPKANETIEQLKNIGKLKTSSIIEEVSNEISRLQKEKAPFDLIIEQREEAERQRQIEEEKRIQLENDKKQLEEERKRIEEERKKIEGERKRIEEERKKQEEDKKKQEEEKKKQEEEKKKQEEEKATQKPGEEIKPTQPSDPIELPKQPNN